MIALLLSALAAASPAPDAPASASLAVRAGVLMSTGPVRATPAAELGGRLDLPGPFFLAGTASAWVLPRWAGAARTETAVAIEGGITGPLAGPLSWSLAAGPALVVAGRPGAGLDWTPALAVQPALELGTRRKSLAFEAGLTGWLAPGTVRLGASAGVRYLF